MVVLKTILLFLAPLTTKLRFHWWSQSQKLWLLYRAQPSLAVHCSSNKKKIINNNNNNIIIIIIIISLSYIIIIIIISLSYFFSPLFILHFFFFSLSLSLSVFSFFLHFSGSSLCKSLSLTHQPKPLLLSLYLQQWLRP